MTLDFILGLFCQTLLWKILTDHNDKELPEIFKGSNIASLRGIATYLYDQPPKIQRLQWTINLKQKYFTILSHKKTFISDYIFPSAHAEKCFYENLDIIMAS